MLPPQTRTEVPTADGSMRLVLGVFDHGSRKVVALCEMTLLGIFSFLLNVIRPNRSHQTQYFDNITYGK